MLDKTNGSKQLEPIGLVRIGLAADVVVTASAAEEEKNDPDPVIAAAVTASTSVVRNSLIASAIAC